MTDASISAAINIEIAYAMPDRQYLKKVTIPGGTTAREALSFSDLAVEFPQLDLQTCSIGIFGQVIANDRVMQTGDRLEVYRSLQMDPREARRQRAAAKLK